ncbi:MAG: tetratricopeptide repeat protein [bacterium]
MFQCPSCNSEVKENSFICPSCNADLSLLIKLGGLSDAWFNRALEELNNGKIGRALECLSACCVANPNDAIALRALAKVWAQLNCWQESLDALDRASSIDPETPELEEIRSAVRDAQSTKTAVTRKATSPKKSRKNKSVKHVRDKDKALNTQRDTTKLSEKKTNHKEVR